MDARIRNYFHFPRCRTFGVRGPHLWPLVATFSIYSLSIAAWSAQPLSETIRVQSFPTHSRLSFRVDDNVPVEWKETGDGFQMIFKGLGFTDLGAPLGGEEAWVRSFQQSLQESRLASVELREVAGGLLIEGKWRFETGPMAPAERKMETFDYREHSPGQLIIDFWPKKGPTVAEVEAVRKKQAKARAEQLAREVIGKRVNRRIAAERSLSDLNNLGKFCAQPLQEQRDVFLTFLPVGEKIAYAKYLPQRMPDYEFPYFSPTGEAADAQYVRLALRLYREEKFGLVVRTLDFMDAEHPTSPYRAEMSFLRANAFIRLGMKAEGERLLGDIKVEAKGKPVALYAGLYLAAKMFQEGAEGEENGETPGSFRDPLKAYETFSWLFTNYPEHRLAWLFHLGAAEALAAIKQTELAAKEYHWVADHASDPWQKAQGALRLGNIYLERRQYAQSLEAYARGLKSFSRESENFPSVHLNRGESLYGLGEFEEARKVFEKFTTQYTGYPEGWRATIRLGEIFGRRAGIENEKLSRQWFYETINHYPLSPGATIARLRLLPCGDHGGFTFESAQRFFESEAKNFDASPQLSMVHYPDLRALAQVRAYTTLKREDVAINIAQKELALVRSELVKAQIDEMYEALFRKNILILLDQNKLYEALQFYEERSKYRVKDVPPAAPDYLLRLSLAASRLGLGKLGETLANDYRNGVAAAALAQEGAPVRTLAAEKGSVGTSSDLDTRLKRSEQSFAEARALWIAGEASKESPEGIKAAQRIRTRLEQVSPESPFSFEKEMILGLLEERQGKFKTARSHALKAQVLIPAGSRTENALESQTMSLQVQGWLAGLETRVGEPKSALAMYRDLERRLRAAEDSQDDDQEAQGDTEADAPGIETVASFLGVPPVPTLEQVLMNQGALLDSQKHWGQSAAVYARAVEEGLGGNQALFSYARALLHETGGAKREKAQATLEKIIESKTDDFWKKLAKETLADLNVKRSSSPK